jgi:hypothetical protein
LRWGREGVVTKREGGEGATQSRETERVRERKSFEVLSFEAGRYFSWGRADFKWNSSLEETSSNWNLFLLETSSNYFKFKMPHATFARSRQGGKKLKWNSSLEETSSSWNLSLLETSSQKRLSPSSIVLKQCYLAK